MMTTNDFLDALKLKHNLPSDYAVGQLLGVKGSCISNYRKERSHLDEAMSIKVAEKLEISAEFVLTCVSAERARTNEGKKAWESIAKKLGGVAASVLMGCTLFTTTPETVHAASNAPNFGSNTYYVK